MCPPAYREPTSPDDSRLADPRAQSLCSHLQPHGSSPTLAALPQELLHEVFRTVALAGPRDLCTLACVCACFLSVLGGGESDSLWAIAARSARVGRAEGLSWRRVLLEVSHVRMLLLPHTMQPPSPPSVVPPRKSRCQRDSTSAFSVLKMRAQDKGSSMSPKVAPDALQPFALTERAWLAWFSRVSDGTLLLEEYRNGRPAAVSRGQNSQCVHLHNADGDCIACALQPDDGSPLGFPAGATLEGQRRLLRAVSEYRHRLRIVRRLYVLSEAVERDRRTRACLEIMHASVVVHLRSVQQLNEGIAKALPRMHPSAREREAPARIPSVLIVQCDDALLRGGRLSIAGAMELVGHIVRALVMTDAAEEGRIHAVIFNTPSAKAFSTFEKAVRSIAFKSQLALAHEASQEVAI